jgi:hypothetical protein
LIALPVAMAADTPQMEIPDASGAAHSRLKPKYALEGRNPTAAATRTRAYRVQRKVRTAAEAAERRKVQAAVNTSRWSR